MRTLGYPSEVGLWQEIIVWKIILDAARQRVPRINIDNTQRSQIKQKLTWTNAGRTYIVNWYTPNTHPQAKGAISKPEFDVSINDKRILDIESKNWNVNYKPLSLAVVKSQIITRFQYLKADQNVLVISEWRTENSATPTIQTMLNLWHIEKILTHRQATGACDVRSYNAIKVHLEPILAKVLQ